MPRLPRFEGHRFVGTRDDMRFHDCDDEAQFELLRARVESEQLLGAKGLQTFGPDTAAEARNRGFRPVA